MGKNSKKVSTWEDIDVETQNKIIEMRKNEKEYLEKSGYVKWKKYFITGYFSYSVIYYFTYIRKRELTKLNISMLFIPAILYANLLLFLYFDLEYYKKYYINHIELNRIIKKTSKSSEYK